MSQSLSANNARTEQQLGKFYADCFKLREMQSKAWIAPVCAIFFALIQLSLVFASFTFTVPNSAFRATCASEILCALLLASSMLAWKNSSRERFELDSKIDDRFQQLLAATSDTR